jgi:HK97 family phage portal protein
MDVVTRLASWWLGKSNLSNPEPWFVEWAMGGQRSAAGVTVSQNRAMQDMTFMSCTAIRSVDLAKCPLHVYQKRADGEEIILANHPLERVLRKPNSWQDRSEFIAQLQSAVLLRSNGYAGILRNGRGDPTDLIPFWPGRVTLQMGRDGRLYYYITATNEHERFQLSRFAFNPIPAEDMLHVRWLSFDGLLGLSRIGLMREALGLSLALEEHSSKLFANGARPGGVLETDKQLSPQAFDRLKAQWDDHYAGVHNAGRTAVLEEGLTWKAQTMTSIEADTINARRHQREEIAMACEVPLHRLGLLQDKDAAILQAHQLYLNNTISTDAERIEAKINRTFGLDGEQTFVAFDLDYFNRADLQTRMLSYRTGVVGMVMKPNEARRKEGWADVEGGDTLYQPTNVAPIGFNPNGKETGPGSDVTGAPAPGGDGDPAAVPID